MASKAEIIKRENQTLIGNCAKAPAMMKQAWGNGDSQGRKRLEQWDEWFRELAYEIVDMKNLGKLSQDAEIAALKTCSIVLNQRVPQWDRPNLISLVRSTLRANQEFHDYPEKQAVGFEESDDDE